MDLLDPHLHGSIKTIHEQLIAAQETGTRLKLYLQLVDELQKSDLPRAIEICAEAVELARRESRENGSCQRDALADALFHLAMLQARSGNYLRAISIISETLPIIEESSNLYLMARAYNVAGVAFENLGNYTDAIDYLMKALKIFQELGDQGWEAGVLNNIGHLYWQNNNQTWALMYLSLGLHLAEKQNDISLQGDVCESLCSVYLDSKEYETALEYGQRALRLYRETGNRHAEAEVLNSIGDVYQALGDSARGLESYQNSLQLSRETGHQHEEIEALLRIGKHFTAETRCDVALEPLQMALEKADRLETRHSIYECHDALMSLFKTCGDYGKALEHSEIMFDNYRQLHNEEQNQRIQSLVAKHQMETMQKDAEIYRLKNAALQAEINLQKKAHENLQQIAITDHLTGLYNRYHFFELSQTCFQQVVAEKLQLSVIMMDVDNFKTVNDVYGHAAGDVALQKLAAALQGGVRRGDVVARFGGDE
ncbi:MAG: tetratricopeptide repeat-containing diguanylate cyclase, partial [Anaerolineaceae bacterium]